MYLSINLEVPTGSKNQQTRKNENIYKENELAAAAAAAAAAAVST